MTAESAPGTDDKPQAEPAQAEPATLRPTDRHTFQLRTNGNIAPWVSALCQCGHLSSSSRRRGEARTRLARNRVFAKAEQHLQDVGAAQADYDALASL